MPTGFEDTIAGLLAPFSALTAAGTLVAPMSAAPQANAVAQPVAAAGEFAVEGTSPTAERNEGAPEAAIAAGPPTGDGGAQAEAPVTGDRPPATRAHPPVTIELEIVIHGRVPAADAPPPTPPEADAPAAGEERPVSPAPAAPAASASGSGASGAGAGGAGNAAGAGAPPAASPPPAGPSVPWLPADFADAWQDTAALMPPDLGGPAAGVTGEELHRRASARVDAVLNDFVSDLSEADPEGAWSDPALEAAIVKTLAEAGISIGTALLDPASLLRGILRLGSGSAQGIEAATQGDPLGGSMQVVGEASSAVLLVVAPLEAGARTASVRMYGPEELVTIDRTAAAERTDPDFGHNVVRATTPSRDLASHAVDQRGDIVPEIPVAATMPYDVAKLDKPNSGYAMAERAVTEPRAQRAQAAMDRAHASEFNGNEGGIGRYANVTVLDENCSTYAAAIAREAGIWVPGVFGPRITLLWFKYGPMFGNPTLPLITGGGGASEFSAQNGSP